MKKSISFLFYIISISLIITSCAVPSEPSSEIQPSLADTVIVTAALIENVTIQPEPITETPSEPITDIPAEPIILCQNERYTVIAFEGHAYVNFVEGNEPTYDALGGRAELGFTFKELAEGLYYQTLTEDQIARVKCFQPREELGIWLTEYVVRFWPDTEAVQGQLSGTQGKSG